MLSPTSDSEDALTRDRFATRANIIDSAAALISAHGIAHLGINALADAAKCDKVLIYRYFGGLDGVIEALAAERLLWPRVELAEEESDGDASLADAVLTLVLEEWAALSAGALMLQASSAELSSAGPLGASTSMQRREAHARLVTTLKSQHRVPPYIDLPAILEILSAAVTAFALRANLGSVASGSDAKTIVGATFDPSTPQGWRRIEKTLAAMTKALLDASAP
jgi:AcrR family transcriptional regulator